MSLRGENNTGVNVGSKAQGGHWEWATGKGGLQMSLGVPAGPSPACSLPWNQQLPCPGSLEGLLRANTKQDQLPLSKSLDLESLCHPASRPGQQMLPKYLSKSTPENDTFPAHTVTGAMLQNVWGERTSLSSPSSQSDDTCTALNVQIQEGKVTQSPRRAGVRPGLCGV